MEFTELKRMLNDLEIQEDALTDRSIQTLHELKLIFKQRDKFIEIITLILQEKGLYNVVHSNLIYNAKQLIEQATKID